MQSDLADEQKLIAEGLGAFVAAELVPHEALVDRLDAVAQGGGHGRVIGHEIMLVFIGRLRPSFSEPCAITVQ